MTNAAALGWALDDDSDPLTITAPSLGEPAGGPSRVVRQLDRRDDADPPGERDRRPTPGPTRPRPTRKPHPPRRLRPRLHRRPHQPGRVVLPEPAQHRPRRGRRRGGRHRRLAGRRRAARLRRPARRRAHPVHPGPARDPRRLRRGRAPGRRHRRCRPAQRRRHPQRRRRLPASCPATGFTHLDPLTAMERPTTRCPAPSSTSCSPTRRPARPPSPRALIGARRGRAHACGGSSSRMRTRR